MRVNLSLFVFSAILVISMGMAPAFGQNTVIVSTNKASYFEGETILITGKVSGLLGGYDVSLIITAPNESVVFIAQTTAGADKKFDIELIAGGSMKIDGDYKIDVRYGDNKNNAGKTTFEFVGAVPVEEVIEVPPEPTVTISGSKNLIGYDIMGGTMLGVTPDRDHKTLTVSIDAAEDGSIILTIPRKVLDATQDGGAADFIVLIDRESADFEEKITSTHRTLTIPFPAGASEIEIIGTFIIPEFGTLAVMILALAVITIIAVSAKGRIGLLPRY